MSRSIRGRLTLWLALLIALCLTLFALFLYVAVQDALVSGLDHTLSTQARQVASSYDFGGADGGDAGTGQRVDFATIDQFTAGVAVEAFDTHGRLLARSGALGGRPLPLPAPPAALLRVAPRWVTVPAAGGALRVYSLSARQGGRRVGLVVVAAPLRAVTATVRTLLTLLVAGGLVATLLAAVGGGLLVRRGLRPLDEMAAAVGEIDAQGLDRRLELRDPPREVARLARAFDALLERLHAAFAAQRRFVADAAHELRTPVATIHGRTEVLLLDPLRDAATHEGLTLVRDEAARMGRLVANLLLLARGDAGQTIDRRPVELDVLLLEVARQARALARGQQIVLGHEDQALVLGDADLLKQLLLNLVENALAHTPPGGRVTLSLTVAGPQALLAVRDTGAGIAPDDLARIFERFTRVDQARSRHSGGAGLGLAIGRWIAEAHGGHITVESIVGQGSTFTVALPLPDRLASHT